MMAPRTVALLAGLILPTAAAAPESTNAPAAATPKWDNSYNARLWSGYKDNVLLSDRGAEDSPVVGAGFDAMFFRNPENGLQFYTFVTGDYSRYLTSTSVDHDAIAIVQSRLRKRFQNGWEPGITAQYLYFDQVFDASSSYSEFFTVPVQAHTLSLLPGLTKHFSDHWRLETEVDFERQMYQSDLDDYWEGGPELKLVRTDGRRSEAALTAEFHQRTFDTRTARTAEGLSIPGKSLIMYQLEPGLEWRMDWDAQRRWRTVTRASMERNLDNGGGYYGFWRYKLSEQLRYRASDWEIKATARIWHYIYDHQTLSSTDPTRRHRSLLTLTLRGEKTVWKSAKVFASYEHERSISNLRFDEYRVNTVLGGIDIEF